MNKASLFVLLAGLAAGTATVSATETKDEARLLRFPATNSSEVVFSYAGDLYKVSINGGEAKRLTSHKGYEMFARFSPDGKTIAFTGEYDGNREVYSMSAEGGIPVRLTYTSTNGRDELGDRMGPNNIVMTWTNDGKGIVYRNRIGDGFSGNLWTVPADGAMPSKMPLPEGGWCSYSPDGKKMAYNRVMREFRTWKYYRGGMADDVWIYDGKKVENVTNNDAQDIFPMWIGDEIFFASDRDMTMNIFVYNTKTKTTEKVTTFRDFDVKFPSTDGKTIVFEQAGYIWKLDPKTRKAEKLNIRIASDDIYARPVLKNVANNMTATSVNADGTRFVVTARGEVFDVPVGKGVTRNLTRTPGAHERSASYSPDGKHIVYISDATGETELYMLDAADLSKPAVQLTKNNDTYITGIIWMPDSKSLLYMDRKNRLVQLDINTKSSKLVMQTPEGAVRPSLSADGKWLTYTKSGSNDMSVVYVYEMATGKETAVTEKWYNSGSPMFSADGKYLFFTCDRDLSPTYSNVEWNYSYGNMSALYMCMLSKDTPSPFIVKEEVAADSKAPARSGDKKDEAAPSEVKVDAQGIANRIIKLPIQGRARVIYSDGKKIWYSSGRGTNVFDLATQTDESCSESSISYRMGDKKAIVNAGRGKVAVVDFPAARVRADKTADVSTLMATIDYSQEWEQIYDEVWRAFRDGFYLENMHGRDWNAIKAQYAQLVPYAKTRLDLNYIIGEMISELACGHAYVNVGEYDKPERIDMGLLGAELTADKSGFFKIGHILQGAPYAESLCSPLTEPGLGVEEGNFITAIDGISTKTVKNIYELLVGKAGKYTELTVNTKAAEGGKKVIVKPIADEYPLVHYEWIQKNIATVDKLSNGKVGYIYIPDMSQEGLNEFVRYYYPQLDKEALIIDDRANGGGNVSPMILERLMREVYRLDMRRGSTKISTTPEGTHTGPKVLLVNKYSASDGDLFPYSFKATGTGTVIGTRSWGGIIGISGSLPYMDGTDVRVPFFTNFSRDGEWVVENHGVDPDIVLDNDPIKENAGIDQQLEEAVKVALQQIKERVPLPGVPAPRTFKDLGLPETW